MERRWSASHHHAVKEIRGRREREMRTIEREREIEKEEKERRKEKAEWSTFTHARTITGGKRNFSVKDHTFRGGMMAVLTRDIIMTS